MRGDTEVRRVGQVGLVGSARGNPHDPQVLQVLSSPAKPEVESDDPLHAVAMQLPPIPGFDAMGEMARCMVEEYAMMGFSAEMLMKMFQNPFYQALHRVYQARGEEYVQGLLDSVCQPSDRSDKSDGSDGSDRSDRAVSAPPLNDSAPSANDSASSANDSAPSTNDSAPSANGSAPPLNDSAPQSAIRNPQSEIRNPGAPHA